MDPSDPAAPLFTVTDDDHAGWVVVIAVVFCIYSLLAVTAKLLIQYRLATLHVFDYVIVVGAVVLLVQTVLTVAACHSGLGKHLRTLDVDEVVRYNQLNYAFSILATLANGCAKISICLLVSAINHFQGKLLVANRILLFVIIAWMACGIFFTAFQCPVPIDWSLVNIDHCSGRLPKIVLNTTVNILTDLALCVLPIALVWSVHTTHLRKLQIIALFGSRIIVPLATFPILIYLPWGAGDKSDTTWLAVMPTIWLQISVNLSIVTACIPSLKSVLDSLFADTAGAPMRPPPGYELAGAGAGHLRASTELDLDEQLARLASIRQVRHAGAPPRHEFRRSGRAASGGSMDPIPEAYGGRACQRFHSKEDGGVRCSRAVAGMS